MQSIRIKIYVAKTRVITYLLQDITQDLTACTYIHSYVASYTTKLHNYKSCRIYIKRLIFYYVYSYLATVEQTFQKYCWVRKALFLSKLC